VVIHGYCLSACANYIFVATSKTYVLKGSIVVGTVAQNAETIAEIIQVRSIISNIAKILRNRRCSFKREYSSHIYL